MARVVDLADVTLEENPGSLLFTGGRRGGPVDVVASHIRTEREQRPRQLGKARRNGTLFEHYDTVTNPQEAVSDWARSPKIGPPDQRGPVSVPEHASTTCRRAHLVA